MSKYHYLAHFAMETYIRYYWSKGLMANVYAKSYLEKGGIGE